VGGLFFNDQLRKWVACFSFLKVGGLFFSFSAWLSESGWPVFPAGRGFYDQLRKWVACFSGKPSSFN